MEPNTEVPTFQARAATGSRGCSHLQCTFLAFACKILHTWKGRTLNFLWSSHIWGTFWRRCSEENCFVSFGHLPRQEPQHDLFPSGDRQVSPLAILFQCLPTQLPLCEHRAKLLRPHSQPCPARCRVQPSEEEISSRARPQSPLATNQREPDRFHRRRKHSRVRMGCYWMASHTVRRRTMSESAPGWVCVRNRKANAVRSSADPGIELQSQDQTDLYIIIVMTLLLRLEIRMLHLPTTTNNS